MGEAARDGGVPSTSSKFRPDIQGLRAIAVLGVLLYHAGVPGFAGGYVGVDFFFVISGSLITSQLLAGLARDGRIRFGEFYANRIRRILPASLVVLVVTAFAVVLWAPRLLQPEFLRDAIATALYAPNVLFALEGTDYLAETAPSPYQHYWSLGVEEQFYLLWPLILLVSWVVGRGRRPVLLAIGCVRAALSFTAGAVLTFQSQPLAFFLLPTRAWELAAGGLLAIAGPALGRLPSIAARPAGSASPGSWGRCCCSATRSPSRGSSP